ncbi:anti-sigma factor [Kribbella sp. NPDC000426]|uniref:anti-sigma factor n=1 Tax=Kribbella sp. NPDC000426 TaxID=3154255 RepID=UPI0033300650
MRAGSGDHQVGGEQRDDQPDRHRPGRGTDVQHGVLRLSRATGRAVAPRIPGRCPDPGPPRSGRTTSRRRHRRPDRAGGQLKVAAAGLNSGQGFYEVWLINVDGKRMVSLGVLDPRTGGTFQIPPNVTAQGYRIVDVSLEPDDGNPEHSHNSIIRGTLPG